jgi:hypothetical protein
MGDHQQEGLPATGPFSHVAQPPPAVIPPKAEVFYQFKMYFELRSNTAEGGCAT